MATRPYTSPVMAELQALGVLFATPPAGATNTAGIVFDGSGNPTQIQNPAGVLKDFPSAPAPPPAPGGIPIPANNDDDDVVINSAPGGNISIATTVAADGPAGDISISPETVLEGLAGGNVSVTGGNSTDSNGGDVTINGGANFTSGATGAQVLLHGGATNGGDLELAVGGGAFGIGNLVLRSRSGSLSVAAATGAVTTTALGPAAGDVAIAKWVPATVDGVAGFFPFFTVVP